MGNLMSSEATPTDMKKYGVSNATIMEDKILIDKILRKAKEMYDQNLTSFLNEDFCNNVFVAYSKKLYELPIKKNVIEGAYKQINSDSGDDFKLVIKSRSLDDEKYLISELTGRIVEHFKNNKYISSLMHEGLQLSFPDIAYIQDRALMLLDKIDKIEKQKQTGGKSKRNHPLFLDTEGGAFGNNNEENNTEYNGNNENNGNNGNNGNNNNNNILKRNARNTGLNANNGNNGNNENNGNNGNNTVKPRNTPAISIPQKPILERAPNGLSKKQRKQWYREQREKEMRSQPQNNTNINNINSEIEKIKREVATIPNGPIVKSNKNNGSNKAENKEENNIFKSLNLEIPSGPTPTPSKNETIKKPVQFSNNRIGLSNFGKLLSNKPQSQPSQPPRQPFQQQPPRQPFQQQPPRQPFQQQPPRQPFPKKESFYTGRMSNEELRRRKDIESSGDRHCTDEAYECRLTKKQMCEKITYHFIVVNNLIATIVSVVPFPSESGDNYAGGFMFDRMESLRKGVFCLPPHHSEISAVTDDERLHKIFKYINILPKENVSFEETCKRSGGFVLKLSKERMEELGRDDKFGRAYFDFFKKINLFYQEALLNLYNILENLQNNSSISTRRLNELSAKTKQIIDELYLKTQFNYLMAVLVILDFDFAKNTKETKAKDDRKKYITSKLVI
jgi:hypothetical protein